MIENMTQFKAISFVYFLLLKIVKITNVFVTSRSVKMDIAILKSSAELLRLPITASAALLILLPVSNTRSSLFFLDFLLALNLNLLNILLLSEPIIESSLRDIRGLITLELCWLIMFGFNHNILIRQTNHLKIYNIRALLPIRYLFALRPHLWQL